MSGEHNGRVGIAEEDTTPGRPGSILRAPAGSARGLDSLSDTALSDAALSDAALFDTALSDTALSDAALSDTVAFGTTTRRNVRTPTPPANGPHSALRNSGVVRYDRAHRIRIGDSATIVLDRPVLIGRSPRLPRITGSVQHQLVRVDSPKREVSGSHIELSQHGAVVVARDLRATNGSRVLPPSGATRVLTNGESVVVAAGTTIDIGDGNLIWLLGVPGSPPSSGPSASEDAP